MKAAARISEALGAVARMYRWRIGVCWVVLRGRASYIEVSVANETRFYTAVEHRR